MSASLSKPSKESLRLRTEMIQICLTKADGACSSCELMWVLSRLARPSLIFCHCNGPHKMSGGDQAGPTPHEPSHGYHPVSLNLPPCLENLSYPDLLASMDQFYTGAYFSRCCHSPGSNVPWPSWQTELYSCRCDTKSHSSKTELLISLF